MKSTKHAPKLDEILAHVQGSMDRVDVRLSEISIPEGGSTLGAVLKFSLGDSGKRIRPAIVLLSSAAFGRSSDAVIGLAAATECLHSATLVHDDIVDGADSRRGRKAVHLMWSQAAAVLSGDFLFAAAADLVAALGRPRIVRMFADTIMKMCRSEFGSPDVREGSDGMLAGYLLKIEGKTASLFALCCEASAELADAGESAVAAMRGYGTNLGLAFQITDDVLDVMGDEIDTGKPAGNDLRQGLLTLPAIYFLNNGAAEGSLVRRIIDRPTTTDTELRQAIWEMRESGAVEQAMADAGSFAEKARHFIADLPAGTNRTALEDLTHYVINRLS